MKNYVLPILALFTLTLMPGCDLIGDVFEGMMWLMIIVIVIVVLLVIWILKALF